MANRIQKLYRKRRRRKIALGITLGILLFLAIAALVAVEVFTVEEVVITGNEYYDDATIKTWVLSDDYSWNTLYVYFKYRFTKAEAIPFVDTIEISVTLPHKLTIQVYEKGILGCILLQSGEYAYFDKDGFVIELSDTLRSEVPRIDGLDLVEATLYEALPIEEEALLNNLLTLTQLLKKYQVIPEIITYESEDTFLLDYGTLLVELGEAENLSDKVSRMAAILPSFLEKEGILHLENCTATEASIYFKGEEEEDPAEIEEEDVTEETEEADTLEGGNTAETVMDTEE